MAYQKFLVDNVVCNRRFHLCFDDEAAKADQVEVTCSYCKVPIFSARNHPPVTLSRQENLVKTATLSETIIEECWFKDEFSLRSSTQTRLSPPQSTGRPQV